MDYLAQVQDEIEFMVRWRGPNSIEVQALRSLLLMLQKA